MHKPAGYLTTRSDPQGRQTVFDLVEDVPGLTYVGRLDYMTEGVLLLTNQGEAAHLLTHPSSGIERTYIAIVSGDVNLAVRLARKGVELDDGLVRPLHVSARPAEERRRFEFHVTIGEGRNREVRRLCEKIGLTVHRLTRVQFGPVRLGSLPPGQTRGLTLRESTVIAALVGGGDPAKIAAPRRSPNRRFKKDFRKQG